MPRPAFLRIICVLPALLITTVAHAKIRPGDEERLLKVAGEIIARQNAFKSMKLQLIEQGKFQKSQSTAEWTIWIDGRNSATQKKRVVTTPDGDTQQELSRSVRTRRFFAISNTPTLAATAGNDWYELWDGRPPERWERWLALQAPPNPLLDTTRLSEKDITDLQELMVNTNTVWQIDDKPDAQGLVVITRTTPNGQTLDIFVVDTQRGHYIIEHDNHGPAGVQRRRTATLKQFGDVWFPATTTLEYESGSTNTVTCIGAQFDQPIPPQRFELTSLGCAEGAILRHHYIDGRREFHVFVEGKFFDVEAARKVAK